MKQIKNGTSLVCPSLASVTTALFGTVLASAGCSDVAKSGAEEVGTQVQGLTRCVSADPRASDEWCAAADCADDYVQGGFCKLVDADSYDGGDDGNDKEDDNDQQDDGNAACYIVTSWWPGACGAPETAAICDRGWGTYDSASECCTANSLSCTGNDDNGGGDEIDDSDDGSDEVDDGDDKKPDDPDDDNDLVTPFQSFSLTTGRISVGISHFGETLDVAEALKLPGGTFKSSALALAHGYVVFLKLTDLPQRLVDAGADVTTQKKIIASFGPNAFVATGMQESFMSSTAKSGYFQIDEEPKHMWLNAQGTGDATFTSYIAPIKDVDRALVIDGNDARHFNTSSVLKGYFDAVTFMIRHNTPGEGGLTRFGVNYANNAANSAPITLDGQSYSLDASLGLMRLIGYMYNRGPWAQKAIELLEDNQNGAQRISEYIPYANDWGPRYMYQLPAIFEAAEASAKTDGYALSISKADVLAYLDTLDSLYTSAVLNAGKAAAEREFGSNAMTYNSAEFFTAFSKVATAMLEETLR